VRLWPERLTLPLRWRTPRRVFVNSMSDLFIDDVGDEFVARVFAVMIAAPQHTFQVLTKRHGRMRSLLSGQAFWRAVAAELGRLWNTTQPAPLPGAPPWIWLGVSVEDQKRADLRIPALLNTPAAVRFLSCEPLLGPVDLTQAVVTMGSQRGHGLTASWVHAGGCCQRGLHGIAWVITGGESGPRARPMHPDWARSLRDQCTAAGVAFFFKQWGEWTPLDPGTAPGHEVRAYPGALLQRVGKKAAGRELDGRTWDEYPTGVPALPAPQWVERARTGQAREL